MNEITVLTPTGCLGNGSLDEESFEIGMTQTPAAVAVDAGSLDPGPYYLGAGKPHVGRSQAKHDLEVILPATLKAGIPLIIGTAGGSGTHETVEWNLALLREVCLARGLEVTVAAIHSDIDKQYLAARAEAESIPGIGLDQALTPDDVLSSSNIVGAMGVEPIIAALRQGPDVVLAGRACDDALAAALPVLRGVSKGPALHMGSILECAGLAAEWQPGIAGELTTNNSTMLGQIDESGFSVRPTNPNQRATVRTVVGHSLYERRDPYRIQDPGGILDLTDCRFEQVSPTEVRVTGSRWVPDDQYTIKLEGAKPIGWRSICLSGIRDPIMISQLDAVLSTVKARLQERIARVGDSATVNFLAYGRDGVMGEWEPETDHVPVEVGLVIDVVSPSQAMAHDVCELVRALLLFQPYDGRLATAGNLAFAFNPRVMDTGQVYQMSVHHALQVDDPCELFPIETQVIGA